MSVFTQAGPAEILRSVQKDRIIFDSLEKELSNLLIKIGGTAIWLRYRQLVHVCSKLLYYTFTTLSGYQTLGEEYTNIVEVDLSLRYSPTFLQRLIMAIIDAGGITLFDYILNKCQRKIVTSTIQDRSKEQLIYILDFLKITAPFLIHVHHAIFYWNGAYYDLVKRTIGIKYILTKPWLSKNRKLYGFKILAVITLLHTLLTAIHSLNKWRAKIPPSVYEQSPNELKSKSDKKCPLCLEQRTYASSTLCGHLFCWYCIYNWLQTNDQCPICRETVEPSRIVPLRNHR